MMARPLVPRHHLIVHNGPSRLRISLPLQKLPVAYSLAFRLPKMMAYNLYLKK